MKSNSSQVWPMALGIGLSISGMSALTTLLPGDHGLLEALGTQIVQPGWAGLIFLLLSLIASRNQQRLPAVVSAFAVIACTAFNLLTNSEAPSLGSFWATGDVAQASLASALAVAVLVRVLADGPARYQIFASIVSMVSALYVVLLVQIAGMDWSSVNSSPAELSRPIALGLILTLFLLDKQSLAFRRDVDSIAWTAWPVLAAGITATVGIGITLWSNHELPINQRLSLIALFAGLICYITASRISNIRLSTHNVKLGVKSARMSKLVRSMRERMQTRMVRLRRSERRYKTLFDHLAAPIFITSPSGQILSANPAMRELLGFGPADDPSKINFSDFYESPVDRQNFIENWHNSGRDQHTGEVKLRRLDGRDIYVLFAGSLIRSANGEVEYQQSVFTDISRQKTAENERRAMESNLRLSQKLESVGRLAAGVAHEINTPMQYIGDNVYYLRESFETFLEWREELKQLLEESSDTSVLAKYEELEEELEIADTAAAVPGALKRTKEGIESVNAIVAAMKELAHPDSGAKGSTDINAIVRNALVMTRSEYKTVAEIATSFGDLVPIVAHKNELAQVFINMIVNAAHAIDGVADRPAGSGLISVSTSQLNDDQVLIKITDNGGGIPAAVVSKIFDPFFTTKSIGKGTGQGLAIARATVVDRHSGSIDIDSTVGEGTTFSITLPVDPNRSQGNSVNQEVSP